MLAFFRNFLQPQAAAHMSTATAASAMPTIDTAPETSVTPAAANDLAQDAGFLDARMSGWFNDASGELLQGFPILAQDHVLDVGCGDGLCIHFCANQGAEVSLVDIDTHKVQQLQEKLRHSPARAVHALSSDANPLPLPSAFFDKIINTEVLEHVDDPAQFLRELVRVGKPGALYLLAVPHSASEGVQKLLAPAVHFEKPNHIRIFTPESFTTLVQDAGLKIERTMNYGFFASVFWAFFWTCDQDLDAPRHPLLQSWEQTWKMMLSMRDGPRIQQALDAMLPKSQVIIARKPL